MKPEIPLLFLSQFLLLSYVYSQLSITSFFVSILAGGWVWSMWSALQYEILNDRRLDTVAYFMDYFQCLPYAAWYRGSTLCFLYWVFVWLLVWNISYSSRFILTVCAQTSSVFLWKHIIKP